VSGLRNESSPSWLIGLVAVEVVVVSIGGENVVVVESVVAVETLHDVGGSAVALVGIVAGRSNVD